MAEGLALDLIAKALETLGKAAFEKAAAWWGARDELNNLKNTIIMIQAEVNEAEQRQEDASSELIKLCLPRLKQVCRRVGDLSDKDHFYDQRKQQREGTALHKVGGFFSKAGPLYYNSNLVSEIKSIRTELDAIRSDININPGNIARLLPAEKSQLSTDGLMQKRETASFVNAKDVIGRKKEQKRIIEMLFNPKYDRVEITVIPIVGSGGIGKTTLAQYVFNDDKVQKHFDLTGWAYVPKKDDKTAMMKKIFKSFTDKKCGDASLDDIQRGIIRSIRTKKFLLVLNDLWDDTGDRLTDLLSLLKCGKRGSKVIVTTRSNEVATAVGTVEVPKLGYLPRAKSLKLFKKLAFKPGQEHKNPGLSKIGEEIVRSCQDLPLAIKVVAGSLRSKKTEKEWLLVRDAQRSKAQQTNGDVVMATLKISYDDLSPILKNCFAYCSLFPKGHVFEKDDLVHLWMAQQYFEPSKDIGDQYFLDLLERNLFQCPKFSSEGDVRSGRMHDLMHDLAQHVAGAEFMLLGGESPIQVSNELVHINLNRSECPPSLHAARNLRSLLSFSYEADHKHSLSKIESLRALKVKHIRSNELPSSIGKLILMRYLDLGKNEISFLPDKITELMYLQTLKLVGCEKVKELPRNFAKLANLRHLLLPKSLTDLPSEFEKLTSLQELNRYIVGKNNGIDSLPALNLRGELKITFAKWREDTIGEVKRANLKKNKGLTSITLELNFGEEEATPTVDQMNKMLKCFKLPPSLKHLVVRKYRGDKMPTRWLDGLSQLVSVDIVDCKKCKVLPHLSRLPSLKYLRLESLKDLKYVEDENDNTAAHNVHFPSLETLYLRKCTKLSNWTRPLKDDGKQGQLLFPRFHKLNKLEIIDCHQLESLKFESPNAIRRLKISGCKKLRNMSEGLQNLSLLEISQCEALRILEGKSKNGWHCLSSLSELELRNIPKMEKLPHDITCLTKLQKLFISNMMNLTELSNETGNLSQLHKLSIQNCPKLKSIPTSIWKLTSLQRLCIKECPDLEKQYKKPDGKNCHLIPPACIYSWLLFMQTLR